MSTNHSRITDWRQIRRYRALALKREGWTREEIAEALDVSERAVSKWMKVAREKGDAALRARPHLGAEPKLSAEELDLLLDFLAAGAETYGFKGEVWTCGRVATVIEWEFGVVYHPAHVSRILKDLHWTPQKPQVRATQRNDREVATWRAEVWPELKKRRSASGAFWSVLTKPLFTCWLGWSELMRLAGKRPRCVCCRPATTCR
jgi:transposase